MPQTSIQSYLAASAAALIAPALVVGVLAQFDFADQHPVLLACTVVATMAGGLTLKWPVRPWRWGLWTSLGFWVLLGLVCLGYMKIGRHAWRPLADAVVVTGGACLGAGLGGLVGRRRGFPR